MSTYAIVLNWNGLSDTRDCLTSLRQVSGDLTTVLVDNGSDADEASFIEQEYPEAILIRNERNLGFAAGNNIGIRTALANDDCDSILILNNDTYVDRDFLVRLYDHLDDNTIVSPKILYAGSGLIQNMGGRIIYAIGGTANINKNRPTEKHVETVYPDLVSGCCFLATKKAFSDIGLFEEKYFAYNEDLDWSLRARQKGYTLKVVPESIIWHKHSQSLKGSYRKVYLIARNNIYFARAQLRGLRKIEFISASIVVGFLLNVVRQRRVGFIPHFIKGVVDGFVM
jgi:GT2 family glycosyltransferase